VPLTEPTIEKALILLDKSRLFVLLLRRCQLSQINNCFSDYFCAKSRMKNFFQKGVTI